MALLIQYTLFFACVLMLVALGGCFSEHSGVINLGLEGIMVMGAMGGALVLRKLSPDTPAILIILASTVAASLVGMIYSSLLAISAIHFKADQTLIGTAMNMLGTALATVIVKTSNRAIDISNTSSEVKYSEQKEAFIIHCGKFDFSWFFVIVAILVVASYIILYKTKFGLRLMACGEHPQAADSVGISVYKMRWAGVLISGFLGGLGGLMYISIQALWPFEYGVAGFGFLSLAVMIFGKWKPHYIALSALLFGFFRALSNVYTGFSFLKDLNIPSSVYNMLPYIVCLIVLVFTSKQSNAPKAEGIPYDKGAR